MLNVGPGEVLVILVIALVVLGPSRLPGTARAMGRILAKTRQIITKFQQEMQAAADAPLEALARERGRSEAPAPSPTAATSTERDKPAASDEEPDEEPDEAPSTPSELGPDHHDAQ